MTVQATKSDATSSKLHFDGIFFSYSMLYASLYVCSAVSGVCEQQMGAGSESSREKVVRADVQQRKREDNPDVSALLLE